MGEPEPALRCQPAAWATARTGLRGARLEGARGQRVVWSKLGIGQTRRSLTAGRRQCGPASNESGRRPGGGRSRRAGGAAPQSAVGEGQAQVSARSGGSAARSRHGRAAHGAAPPPAWGLRWNSGHLPGAGPEPSPSRFGLWRPAL